MCVCVCLFRYLLTSRARFPFSIFVDDFEIYSCSIDNSMRLYDIRMGKMMSYNMHSSILSMDITNDRNYVCVYLIDNTIKLVEKNSGKKQTR